MRSFPNPQTCRNSPPSGLSLPTVSTDCAHCWFHRTNGQLLVGTWDSAGVKGIWPASSLLGVGLCCQGAAAFQTATDIQTAQGRATLPSKNLRASCCAVMAWCFVMFSCAKPIFQITPVNAAPAFKQLVSPQRDSAMQSGNFLVFAIILATRCSCTLGTDSTLHT